MSTPDLSAMEALCGAPPRLPGALLEPIEGVSLIAYLIVEAAHLDGLPRRAVLGWLGVRETAYDRAEERWSERVAGELARDHAGEHTRFDELYEDLLTRALSLWVRPVDPLDRDVAAWITFQRHALEAVDPGEMAGRGGLTAGDELRLARVWRDRMALDREVRERAQAAWSGPLLPLPPISVAPFVFPPAPAAPEPTESP